MRLLSDRRGQTFASGVVAVLLLIAVAAALVDGLHLLSIKQRCLEVASAASLRGASRGRDYAYYLTTGQIALDRSAAQIEAFDAAAAGLSRLGLSGYTVQVEVLDAPGGGSIAGFPPGQTWSDTEPAVGVYLEVPVDTVFMRAINGGSRVVLHVFATAGVTGQ